MKKLYFLAFALLSAGINASAQYTDLLDFAGSDGNAPTSVLVLGGKTLYGMTSSGGTNSAGNIFAIDTIGHNFRDLYDFTGLATGGTPYCDLTPLGYKFYGTTFSGGAFGNGCVFSVDSNGKGYKDIYDFNTGTAGQSSNGSVLIVKNRLYGTTYYGGASGNGCIFSMDTAGGAFKDMYDFTGASGQYPHGNLTLSGKTLYGMTASGGNYDSGVIFAIDTDGTRFRDIFLDCNNANGYNPWRALIVVGRNIYGTMYNGGFNTYGTYFSLDTGGGGYRDMWDFFQAKGGNVGGNLTLIGGTMYGVNFSGGFHSDGDIFSIDTNGANYTDIFDCAGIGTSPQGGLTIVGSTFYGTSANGGAFGDGNVFKLRTSIVTTMNELKANNGEVRVFPNPNNGSFELQISNYELGIKNTVEIYNVLGEKIYTASLNPSNGGTSVISIFLPIGEGKGGAGVYLYRVITESGELIGEGKLIIK